jgi:hypothetical protein
MSINHSKYKIALLIIKYCPILMGLIMYIHTILSYNGITLPIATTLAGSALIPSIIIYSFSNILNFCYIHKAFTIYALANDLCINIHHYWGLGEGTESIQMTSIIIGTILFILLAIKIKVYHLKCCVIKKDRLKYLESRINKLK